MIPLISQCGLLVSFTASCTYNMTSIIIPNQKRVAQYLWPRCCQDLITFVPLYRRRLLSCFSPITRIKCWKGTTDTVSCVRVTGDISRYMFMTWRWRRWWWSYRRPGLISHRPRLKTRDCGFTIWKRDTVKVFGDRVAKSGIFDGCSQWDRRTIFSLVCGDKTGCC